MHGHVSPTTTNYLTYRIGLDDGTFISHNVSIKWFLCRYFAHKTVNLLLTVPCYKIKLTGLWGS